MHNNTPKLYNLRVLLCSKDIRKRVLQELSCMVENVGLEPLLLPPKQMCCQLHYILETGAPNRTWTDMLYFKRGILSPLCLPIPPQEHMSAVTLRLTQIISCTAILNLSVPFCMPTAKSRLSDIVLSSALALGLSLSPLFKLILYYFSKPIAK